MKLLMMGFSGWVRMEKTQNPSKQAADLGITVVGTVLLGVTYLLIHTKI